MSTTEQIDSLFAYLYKKGSTYTPYRQIVSEHFKNDETSFDIEGMLIKLERDGFVDTGELNRDVKDGYSMERIYKLSFEGRFLYENSSQNKPYCGLKRRERQKYNWTVAKIIAATANALIIIAVSIWAVCVSDKTNKLEQQAKTYEDSISKLNRFIK